MRDYLNYSLQDLLLFSPDVYFRLLERYNQDIWPLQVIALLLGVILIWQVWRRDHFNGWLIAGGLALSWLWCGLVFHISYYASLNWVAPYFGALFILQGAGLLIWGMNRETKSQQEREIFTFYLGLGLIFFAVLVYPLLWLVDGHSWREVQIFGTSQNATLIATVGVLLCYRASLILLIIPLIFLVINALTAWLLGSIDWIVSGVVFTLIVLIWLINFLGRFLKRA